MGLQPQFTLLAKHREKPALEPRRLSGRGARALRRVPHAAQFGFALDNRKKFAGAMTAGWHAFNITSDKGTGIGGWSDDEVTAYLSKGHALNHGTAAGPMGEAVDQSFSHMSQSDIAALVVYLRSVPAIAAANLPATIAPPAPPRPRKAER